MIAKHRPGQCALLVWTAFFVLFSSLNVWSADDTVTLAWPERGIDQKKLERAARLVLVNRIGMQRIKFVWDKPIELSDRVKLSVEAVLRKSLGTDYNLQNLSLVKKEWDGGNVVFHYKFDKPKTEKINISKSALHSVIKLAARMQGETHMPALIELALSYPDIMPKETIENLWRSFLPYHSYDVIFDKKISNFGSVKFVNRNIPVGDLPATLVNGLKMLDLAPTNSIICFLNAELAEPGLPRLSTLLTNYCRLLPNKNTLISNKNSHEAQEIKTLKNKYSISLQDKPLLYFWITSHNNFTFDELLFQRNFNTLGGSQKNTALLELFNRLPPDNLNVTKLHDFIMGLRGSGFEAIPALLLSLMPEELGLKSGNNHVLGGVTPNVGLPDENSKIRADQESKKQNKDNNIIGIH
jgi:hypothetical protein